MSLLALKLVVEPTNSTHTEVQNNTKTNRFLPICNSQRQVLLTESLEFGFSLRIFAQNKLVLQSLSSINNDILQVQKHLFYSYTNIRSRNFTKQKNFPDTQHRFSTPAVFGIFHHTGSISVSYSSVPALLRADCAPCFTYSTQMNKNSRNIAYFKKISFIICFMK